MFDSVIDDFKNAWNRPNNAHVQLIIINAVVFVLIGFLGFVIPRDSLIGYVSLPSSPLTLLYRPWTIISYMFVHFGFMHILSNMLMLYWFGGILAQFIGGTKNTILYVLGGLGGAMLYILAYQFLPAFSEVADIATLHGASAGVTAIVVAAATLMPNYTMSLLLLGPVKLKYIAGVVVLLSLFNTTGYNAGGEISHLGGAVIGFAYIRQLQAGKDWGAWILTALAFMKSFFVKQPNIKVSYKSPPKSSPKQAKKSKGFFGNSKKEGDETVVVKDSTTSQEEIDNILDKISQSGYESLSKLEKQKLFEASKK